MSHRAQHLSSSVVLQAGYVFLPARSRDFNSRLQTRSVLPINSDANMSTMVTPVFLIEVPPKITKLPAERCLPVNHEVSASGQLAQHMQSRNYESSLYNTCPRHNDWVWLALAKTTNVAFKHCTVAAVDVRELSGGDVHAPDGALTLPG